MTATRRPAPLPDGRAVEIVPADDAGEFTARVAVGVADLAEQQGLLTWRQAEALRELQRRYRASGGRLAWQRNFEGRERSDDALAAGKAAWQEMHDAVPMCWRPVLLPLGQGEWPTTVTVATVQSVATRLADRLGYAA